MNKREVPQFINIEDKIAFQLTAKQLGWAALGGFFVFMSWVFLKTAIFVTIAVVVGLIDVAILFVRPYGMSMPEFIKNTFLYLFKTKNYVWRRADKKVFKKEKNNQDDNNKKIKPESKRSRKVPEDFRKAVKALDIFED